MERLCRIHQFPGGPSDNPDAQHGNRRKTNTPTWPMRDVTARMFSTTSGVIFGLFRMAAAI
jgi:hypothetical protein